MCATAIAVAAMCKGYDTALVGATSAVIGTIAGYAYGKSKKE